MFLWAWVSFVVNIIHQNEILVPGDINLLAFRKFSCTYLQTLVMTLFCRERKKFHANSKRPDLSFLRGGTPDVHPRAEQAVLVREEG